MGTNIGLISIVSPVFNEEEVLDEFIRRVVVVCSHSTVDFELILVDNASTDSTRGIIGRFSSDDSRIKYIRLSRNFGPRVDSSILAGLEYASGDACIVIYSDLQDPPELILDFLKKWHEGYDVVYGVQLSREGEPLWRKTAARIYYRLMTLLSDMLVPSDAGDFRLMSRRVVDALVAMPERERYTRGLVSWLGFRQCGIPYHRDSRFAGTSKAPFWSILGTAWSGVTSFSQKPLRIVSSLGLASSALFALIGGIFVVLAVVGNPVPGLTSIVVAVLLGASLNLAAIGVVGEYVGKIVLEVKRRPIYVVEETSNVD